MLMMMMMMILTATPTGSSIRLGLFFSWSLLELHLAKMQNGRRALVETDFLDIVETQYVERLLQIEDYHFTN